MSILNMIFKKRKPIIATLPSQPENKPDHAKPADTKPADAKPARNKRTGAGESASWTNRMQDLLESARQFDRQSIPNLVDILFETPIPVNSPSISDGEVSALLNYPGRSPAIEVESVTAATEYQTWIRECNAIVSSLRDVLNGFPNCILQGELLDLAIAAAGYDLNIQKSGDTHDHLPGNIAHINVFVGTKNSIAAVNQLCTMVTPVTSNLLHKVAQKKKIQLKTGSCTHFSLETIWFSTECEAAATALAARGNPLYDPEAYFTH